MVDNFEKIIRKAVTQYVSVMADEEIDKACAEFRGKMLAMKPDLVRRIINGMDVVTRFDGMDGYTVQIILKR